ncbi:SIMPL domain-containing protein [Polyangium aurulentum]|uniref:SIMPL domain-containing protein n=1 Tax=Polyangium aurulentum TaxID=2567896 RepID=UPI0010ADCE9F|nr:SIMPL domain-containing protein [Polyangium aurulentum]UQA61965.1 SIMPL domain-containing protein [Polyangium aurulentum]
MGKKKLLLGRGSVVAGLAFGLMSLVAPGLAPKVEAAEPSQGTSEAGQSADQSLAAEQLGELISTSGRGEVSVQPDSMRGQIGVEVQAETLESARAQQARMMTAVLKAIEELGLSNLETRTSQLQVFPVYEKQSAGTQEAKVVGFRARNTVRVTLRGSAPEQLGEQVASIVDAGMGAGANLIEGVSFFLAEPQEVEEQALKLAVQEAEQRAQVMAEAAGVKAIRLHSLDGSPESGRPIFFESDSFAMAARSAEIATPVEPGEITISATVSAKFHFAKE